MVYYYYYYYYYYCYYTGPLAWETWVQSQVVIPKTQKMVLDDSLLNTQHYKVRIKRKVDQCRERSSALSYTSVL